MRGTARRPSQALYTSGRQCGCGKQQPKKRSEPAEILRCSSSTIAASREKAHCGGRTCRSVSQRSAQRLHGTTAPASIGAKGPVNRRSQKLRARYCDARRPLRPGFAHPQPAARMSATTYSRSRSRRPSGRAGCDRVARMREHVRGPIREYRSSYVRLSSRCEPRHTMTTARTYGIISL